MGVTIYHNPKCGTSRNVLALLREKGIEPNVVEYLKAPPDKSALEALIAKTGQGVREVLREKGTPFEELDLGNAKWSDDALFDFIVAHPILLNRPIVETDETAKLCRPSETVLDFIG